MAAPPFAQLHMFLAVARSSSFSAAARELGVSRSAVSQAVRVLEEQLNVVLVQRTTRSVRLTDAGRRLLDGVGPAFAQAATTLTKVAARPGEVVGRLRLSVPRIAVPFVVEPVLPLFRRRHPRIDVEIAVADHFVDIVGGGFDAGVRLDESIERDMTRIRLTDPFRFVVVATPAYLRERGVPETPEALLTHDCIGFRLPTSGALYGWELERGRRTWRVPVGTGVTTNDASTCATLAKLGLGLAYVPEPIVRSDIDNGVLAIALEAWAPKVPGFFMYYPSRTQRTAPLRLFIDTAKAVRAQAL